MKSFVTFTVVLLTLAPTSPASFLPFLDRLRPGPPVLSNHDPYRVLEHIPFALDLPDAAAAAVISPAWVDWKETPEAHQITIDVPGLKREELKIEVEEQSRVLRVSGERKREEEEKGDRWHSVERVYGRFWRQFRLPDNVDLESVRARLEDGVLVVTVAKSSPEMVKGPRVVSIGGVDGDWEEREKVEVVGTGEVGKKTEL